MMEKAESGNAEKLKAERLNDDGLRLIIYDVGRKACFSSDAGHKVTVQLSRYDDGGHGLAISSEGFEHGEKLSINDILAIGQCLRSLALKGMGRDDADRGVGAPSGEGRGA